MALVEFCDPTRRAALGMRPAATAPHDSLMFRFAFGWFGLRVAAAVRAVHAHAGRPTSERLATIEHAFAELAAAARKEHLLISSAEPGAPIPKTQ